MISGFTTRSGATTGSVEMLVHVAGTETAIVPVSSTMRWNPAGTAGSAAGRGGRSQPTPASRAAAAAAATAMRVTECDVHGPPDAQLA